MLCCLGFEFSNSQSNDYAAKLFFGVITCLSLLFGISGCLNLFQHYYSPTNAEERVRQKRMINYCLPSTPLEEC